jgi:hypothetical protein
MEAPDVSREDSFEKHERLEGRRSQRRKSYWDDVTPFPEEITRLL